MPADAGATAESFDPVFNEMAGAFRGGPDAWETRQEAPPASKAYLHVSRPSWQDEKMNGVHFETYVLAGQLKTGSAPVALHCERGIPEQAKCVEKLWKKVQPLIEDEGSAWQKRGWAMTPAPGEGEPWAMSSVCEIQVPIRGKSAAEVGVVLSEELKAMVAEMAPLVDKVMEEHMPL